MSERLIPTGVIVGDLASGRISRGLRLEEVLGSGDKVLFLSSIETYSQEDMPV